MNGLPAHDFILVALVPLTTGEVKRFESRQRVIFRKLDVYDRSQVRGSAVYCARCSIPLEHLGDGERDECRGEIEVEKP